MINRFFTSLLVLLCLPAFALAAQSGAPPVNVDNTPADGVTQRPISSNWAYDHLINYDHTLFFDPASPGPIGGTTPDGVTATTINADTITVSQPSAGTTQEACLYEDAAQGDNLLCMKTPVGVDMPADVTWYPPIAPGAVGDVPYVESLVGGMSRWGYKSSFTVADLISLGLTFHFRSDSAVCNTGADEHDAALASLSGYGIQTTRIACDQFPSLDAAVVGVSLISTVGHLTVETAGISISLTGLGTTISLGDMSVHDEWGAELIGLGMTSAVGQVSVGIVTPNEIVLAGISSSVGLGLVTIEVEHNLDLTGLGISAAIGAISVVIPSSTFTAYSGDAGNSAKMLGYSSDYYDGSYAEDREALTANFNDSASPSPIGFSVDEPISIDLARVFLNFDIDSIPQGATVTSATVIIEFTAVSDTGDVYLQQSTAGDSIVDADYDAFTLNGGTSLGVTSVSSTGKKWLALNASGLSMLQTLVDLAPASRGLAKFVFREDADFNDNANNTTGEINMSDATQFSQPRLTIEYTP